MLGDVLMVEYGPHEKSLARIVAIGLGKPDRNIDYRFYEWAKAQGIIAEASVIVEWLGENPLEHNDPKYAPVGRYMTLSSLDSEDFVRRAGAE